MVGPNTIGHLEKKEKGLGDLISSALGNAANFAQQDNAALSSAAPGEFSSWPVLTVSLRIQVYRHHWMHEKKGCVCVGSELVSFPHPQYPGSESLDIARPTNYAAATETRG